jgi:hypothetical protein
VAASKDTFEPKVFASNSFAAGAFRGVGATVTAATSNIFGRLTIEPQYRGKVTIEPQYKGTVKVE